MHGGSDHDSLDGQSASPAVELGTVNLNVWAKAKTSTVAKVDQTGRVPAH
jgi:hypothetical protein